jgi:hypothetical protein
MKTIIALVITTLFASSAFAESLTPGKYSKVYRGEEGMKVTVVPMKPASAKKALVQVSGVETEIDGLVIMHDIVDKGRGNKAYATTLHGEGFWTLYSEKSWGWKQYKVQLPESRMQKLYAYYDETATKKVNAAALYKLHKNQKKQIANLQKWNRKEREARHNNKLNEILADTNKECGTKIAASINWKSVTNDHMKEYSIYSYCGYPLESIESLCRDDKKIAAKVKKEIKRLSCNFGEKMKLDLKQAGINWITNPEEGNQADFTKAFFKNQIQ